MAISAPRQPRVGAAPRRSAPGVRGGEADPGPTASRIAVRRVFAGMTGTYALILGTTIFLVGFGLIMVLSSSSITSYASNANFFTGFVRQLTFAIVALPLMLVISMLPTQFLQRYAAVALLGALCLQLLVFTPLGYAQGGNRNWITLFGVSMQPSELIKLTLALWIAMMIVRRPAALTDWRALITPIAPVVGFALLLVLWGQDLGTAVMIAMLCFGALFFAGVRARFLLVGAGFAVVAAIAVAQLSPSRVTRITQFFTGECDYMGSCWQSTHALYALSAGGLFGVGLGNSKAKWSWLPEVEHDFIFAVIGEELGLLGAIVVLILYIVLAVGMIRVIVLTTDPFVRIVTGAVVIWIVGQALVNIAVVIGLLPVLGVPLPLISSGGSALLTTMMAIGVVLSFARRTVREPGVETR